MKGSLGAIGQDDSGQLLLQKDGIVPLFVIGMIHGSVPSPQHKIAKEPWPCRVASNRM
jgi:hypothetical protein